VSIFSKVGSLADSVPWAKAFITLVSNITFMRMTQAISTPGHHLFSITSQAPALILLGKLVLNCPLGIAFMKIIHPSITPVWL
jgi:hypothetical protein